MGGGQRTPCRNWFSLSIMRVAWTEFGPSGFKANALSDELAYQPK